MRQIVRGFWIFEQGVLPYAPKSENNGDLIDN